MVYNIIQYYLGIHDPELQEHGGQHGNGPAEHEHRDHRLESPQPLPVDGQCYRALAQGGVAGEGEIDCRHPLRDYAPQLLEKGPDDDLE